MAEILLGNIKGEKGADGTSAVITDVSATVDNTIGTPSVTVTMGGTESKRSFLFAFSGLKGEKGDTGNTGEQGEPGTSVVGEDDIHINEEIPIYEEATTLAPLSSGEKISIAFGKIKKAVGELIAHLINHENPHNVTASQVGLGNVDNTSDLDKPISKATSEAISGANSLTAKVQDNLNTHSNDSTHITYAERTAWNSKAEGTHSHDDKYYTEAEVDSKLSGKAPTSHTHSKGEITDFPTSLPASDVPNWAKQSTKPSYTASEVGLGNVPNVATNDQTPTYTEASSLTTLTSGEKMSVAFGKIKKAITDLISHIADTTKHISSTERTTWNGKAPQSHASTATTYGVGTSSNYGHLKITDAVDSTATDTAASAKALKTVNDMISSLSGSNAKFKFGSYVGNGKFGESNPNTLTFDFTPKLILFIGVYSKCSVTFAHYAKTEFETAGDGICPITFSNNSVSWYNKGKYDGGSVTSTDRWAEWQANLSGTTYYYVAIGV